MRHDGIGRPGPERGHTRDSYHRLTAVDTENRTAICSQCGPTGIRPNGFVEGIQVWSCIAKTRGARRAKLSAAEYLAAVKRGCALCGRARTYRNGLHVDHDHVTGKLRGLLCNNCNRGIGLFGEDPELLRAAADYIDLHRIIEIEGR